MLTSPPPLAATLALAACAATLLSAPAAAAERVLANAPGSSWNVDNGQESCRLQRDFGEGEDRVTLLITQWAPGNGFQMALAGAPLDGFDPARQILVAFGETAELGRRPASASGGTLEGAGRALIFSSLNLTRVYVEGEPPPEAPADPHIAPMLPPIAVAAADRIELLQEGRTTLRLQPTSFANSLAVLDACSQQRLAAWGLDVEAHRTMTRRVELLNLATIADRIARYYPAAARMRMEQGNLHVRVLVDEAGAASDCAISAATTTQKLDSNACWRITEQARFRPALDAQDQPMKSFYTTSILYRMD